MVKLSSGKVKGMAMGVSEVEKRSRRRQGMIENQRGQGGVTREMEWQAIPGVKVSSESRG